MMSPSALAVFALKFLQKSMMLTPCGPSAVLTGGAGVALPAAIWSFTTAWIFFDMSAASLLFSARGAPPPRGSYADASPRIFRPRLGMAAGASNLLHLQEVQFDRRRAAEDRHHHLQRVPVDIDLIDHAVEARKRTFVDANLLALLEHVLRLRFLGRRLHLRENLLDLVLAERRRLGARADEARHLRRVLHHVPRVV